MDRRRFMETMGGMFAASQVELKGSEAKEMKPMDIKEVQQFVLEARQYIKKEFIEGEHLHHIGCCCIDGRRPTDEKQKMPPFSIPGGDEGLMANILGALNKMNLTSTELKQKAIDLFINFRGGEKNMAFHTDDDAEAHKHGDSKDIARGCGHFRFSTDKPKEHNLVPEDVELITERLNGFASKGAKREILHGVHEERAVVIIDDVDVALNHSTKTGQVYVYNRGLHNKFLDDLSLELAEGLNIPQSELGANLKEMASMQLMATAKKLAKGLPIYSLKNNTLNKDLERI